MPDGKSLMPGVVGHSSDLIEDPELVAERLVRYAGLVGRENVIAGHGLRAGPAGGAPGDRLGEARGERGGRADREQTALELDNACEAGASMCSRISSCHGTLRSATTAIECSR